MWRIASAKTYRRTRLQMSDNKAKLTAIITLVAAMALVPIGVAAQSSGGGSSGGGASGGASSGGGSAGGGAASRGSSSTGGATSPSIGRAGAATGTRSGAATTNDPRTLSNQPATTTSPTTAPGTYAPGGTPAPAGSTAPSGTAYPSGPALEAARQRAMQSPPGTQIPPSSAGSRGDRSGTSDVGRDSDATAATPGLPNEADPNRASRTGLTAGGTPRQGAVGKTMAECEAAWDSKTHMSKDTWRDTCRRTLTEPHL